MISNKPKYSTPVKWGAILISSILLLTSCAKMVTWSQNTYEISYDSSIFFEKVNKSDEINLVIKGIKDSPQINVIAIHPALIDFDLGTDKYFEQAIYSFESKLDKLTNSITKSFELEGIKERRTSVTGKYNDNETMQTGFFRIIISSDTILTIEVIGPSDVIAKNNENIQKVIDSAKVKVPTK